MTAYVLLLSLIMSEKTSCPLHENSFSTKTITLWLFTTGSTSFTFESLETISFEDSRVQKVCYCYERKTHLKCPSVHDVRNVVILASIQRYLKRNKDRHTGTLICLSHLFWRHHFIEFALLFTVWMKQNHDVGSSVRWNINYKNKACNSTKKLYTRCTKPLTSLGKEIISEDDSSVIPEDQIPAKKEARDTLQCLQFY